MARSGNRQSRPTAKKNVVHKGQRAVLNGKPVVADGNGNWKSIPKGSAGNGIYTGSTAGSYKKGENRKSTPTKSTPTKTKSNNAAAINAQLKKERAARERAASRSSGGNNSQILRPAPANNKPKPTPTPTPTPTPSPTKTKPAKPAATSPKKLTPMQQWAKAHPKLAAKVKKGQSGAKELKIGRSTKPRSWLADNYKPGKKK